MADYDEISLKSDQNYTSCYCEENVWKLCDKIRNSKNLFRLHEEEKTFVVFISNDKRTVPLWHQSASKQEEGLVIWDYHVIFIVKNQLNSTVYDLDTSLPYPSDFDSYSKCTFKSDEDMKQQYHRKFRVIKSKDYLGNFASDRSHMKDKSGQWVKPPPTYPCIQISSSSNNIDLFISMDGNVGWGNVLSLTEFNDKFSYKRDTH